MLCIWKNDCLQEMKRIEDEYIELVVTDPPYGINFISGHRKDKYKKILNDDNLNYLNEYFKECYRIMKNNTAIYCFCSWHNVDIFKQNFEKYFKLKNIIIWQKNNIGMGDLKGSYAPKYEMILYGVKGKRDLECFRYPDVIFEKKTCNKIHPTQKPVKLLEKFIENSSCRGDIVFDGFAGSGSTGIAALNLHRHFIGIEIDENYFELAKKRLYARAEELDKLYPPLAPC